MQRLIDLDDMDLLSPPVYYVKPSVARTGDPEGFIEHLFLDDPHEPSGLPEDLDRLQDEITDVYPSCRIYANIIWPDEFPLLGPFDAEGINRLVIG